MLQTVDRALTAGLRQVYWLPTASNAQRDITEGLKSRLTPYRAKTLPPWLSRSTLGIYCGPSIPTRVGHYSNCQALLKLDAKHGNPVVQEFCTDPTAQQGALELNANGWVEMSLSTTQNTDLPYGVVQPWALLRAGEGAASVSRARFNTHVCVLGQL